ncbi:MAG: ATP-binding protein, partial [Bacteroidota bacterium]
MSKTTKNLKTALEFLELVIQQRIEHHFRSEDFELDQLEPIKWSKKPSPLSAFCQEHKVSMAELIVVLLALAPHLDPAFLSNVIRTHLPQSGDFPEIGGQKDGQNRYFLPTGETAFFLIAGKDLATRLEYLEVLTTDHWFHQKQIVTIGDVKAGESLTAGRLILDQEYVELFL